MKHFWKHFLAGLLAFAMMISILPLVNGTARAETYGKTTATGVRLRKKPSVSAGYWFRLPINYICAYTETKTDSQGVTWYKVSVTDPETRGKNKYTGYIHGNFYTPIEESEAAAAGVVSSDAAFPNSSSANTSTADTTTSDTSSADTSSAKTASGTSPSVSSTAAAGSYGYVKTKVSKVNMRVTPGGAIQDQIAAKGTVLPVTGAAVSKLKYTWYPVKTASGKTGYLRGDCVTVCDANGNTSFDGSSSVSSPTASTTSTTAASETAATETTSGSALGYVKTTKSSVNLRSKPAGSVLGQVKKGVVYPYYEKTSSGGYTWYKVNANYGTGYLRGDCVKETTGGEEEEKTTSASTQTQDYANLSMTIYPAEKIDWFTGGIQELIPKGSNFKVYDVKTGIVWWAHRWAGGNHADVETLTAADTARLCKIYGVSDASKITDWQRRPCLITVGGRTFACALYGVPHNSDGDTIADNNLDGQVCLHFTNSRTHGSNKVVSYNEEAIEYAWTHAPNGYK